MAEETKACAASCKVLDASVGERKIGYCVSAPAATARPQSPNNNDISGSEDDHRQSGKNRTIVYFGPIGSSSLIVMQLSRAMEDYDANMICVDRPGCGETSDMPRDNAGRRRHDDAETGGGKDDDDGENDEDVGLRRIRFHVDDVLDVLRREGSEDVYALGICIGHAFAVELCRRLINNSDQSKTTPSQAAAARPPLQIKGLTLVAPFVSPACPDSWRIAKLGASVPSSVLFGFTELACTVASAVVPTLLHYRGSSMFKSLVSEQERKDYGWTDEDFDDLGESFSRMKNVKNTATGEEARLGVSNSWQWEVCDRFAVESRCGLILRQKEQQQQQQEGQQQDEKHGSVQAGEIREGGGSGAGSRRARTPLVPVRVHACIEDKVSTFASVKWIATRCYGGLDNLVVEDKIHSHELMTLLGGPPRNPSMLHEIARDWGIPPSRANEHSYQSELTENNKEGEKEKLGCEE